MNGDAVVALIGAGLIGRSWAYLFACNGFAVRLYDPDTEARDRAKDWLEGQGVTNLLLTGALDEALRGSAYVQESVPERLEVKQAIYTSIAPFLEEDAIVASSTSALEPDMLFENCPFRERALVAHPTNPPHVLPAVELATSRWTSSETLARTRSLMERAGQAPIVLKRVLPGFVVNRLQAALVNEALALVADGVADPDDIDVAVRQALGLRWAFIGPFETMDLNAAEGFEQYARIFGPVLGGLARDIASRTVNPWTTDAPAEVARTRRSMLPLEELAARTAWRDANIQSLRVLKAAGLSPTESLPK
jgi:3-hydroxyacyl-CoA dehydrogenase